MKLALIRRQFSPTGGAELYLDRLVSALAGAGHEPHVFAESWNGDVHGGRIHLVPTVGSRAQRAMRFSESVREAIGKHHFDCVFSLERTLRQDVYRAGDGVHRVWLERRREFAKWWRKPFIGLGAFHDAMRRLEAGAFDPRNTGRVIVNSEMVRREILAHFPFPADRIHLVLNGVDAGKYKSGDRAGVRQRHGIAADDYLVLFAGSGWERKGLRFLIEAVERLRGEGVKLLVAGKGRPPARAPVNVLFAGPVAGMADYYAAADLFALLPIYEPSANVCFEAQAAGLPVITSAQNGAAEIIRNDVNGTVVGNPGDVDAVTHAIKQWRGRRIRPVPQECDLSLERNLAETMVILERAARERNT